jgi:hypothetical protein
VADATLHSASPAEPRSARRLASRVDARPNARPRETERRLRAAGA